jgi:hypothetical protein
MLFNSRFHKGSSRYVLVIPFLKIVLKFPVVSSPYAILEGVINRCENAIKHNTWPLARKIIFGSADKWLSVRWGLLRGIVANWREYRFYKNSDSPLLWPTYFSLFGLVNVQPMAMCHPTWKSGVWPFVRETTLQMAYDDSHVFSEMPNYTVDDTGHLRIIDYANPRGQAVITKYGKEIYAKSRSIFNGK